MKRKKKLGWITGGIIIAITIVGLSFIKLDDEIVFFYTPTEAFAKASQLSHKTIKVGGMVREGTVKFAAEDLNLNFIVSDLKEVDIAVNYKGTPPDLFKEGAGVVVEGRISADGQTLHADNLMVKHSEEYKMPDDTSGIDHALLQQSLFKE